MSTKNQWVIAGTVAGTLPAVGALYEVRNERKGTFTGQVKSVDGEWLTLLIKRDTAKTLPPSNVRDEGERITVRDVHTYLIPILAPV